MVKVTIITLLALCLNASNLSCLECHQKQQIPDKMIYKRYLLKYSTQENMKNAILEYLKNPDQKNSIMPSIFFTKFPMKKSMNEKDLDKDIVEFLNIYDVRKRLVLE